MPLSWVGVDDGHRRPVADETSFDTYRRTVWDIFAARAAVASDIGTTPRLWPPVVETRALWPTEWDTPAKQANVTLTLDEALEEVQQWVVGINSAATDVETSEDVADASVSPHAAETYRRTGRATTTGVCAASVSACIEATP